ncbi:hypothetical protein ACYJ1Y_14365 [Natrialbaceae archaeon A-gly3]
MGLFDKLQSDSSDGDQGQKQDTPENIHADYYFIGNRVENSYLDDPILILEHSSNPEEKEDPGDWSIVKCNEPVEIDPEADLKVCVYERGWAMRTGHGAYRSNLAWLLSSEEIESLENRNEIDLVFDFPDALRGTPLPVGSKWSEDELKELLIPLNLPDAVESTKGDETKSRWERLGEKTKRLF